MAHFAKIGLNSKVIAVNAVNDEDTTDAKGVEREEIGREFLDIFPLPDPIIIFSKDAIKNLLINVITK